MRDSRSREYPDVVSFAYWCRKTNTARLRGEAESRTTQFESRIGRGLSFHIAPSNIPVNFAFSFAFGLLAGNSCLVRLPSKAFAQTEIICSALRDLLSDYPQMRERCAFVTYPRDNSITEAFSRMADVRVIWGGDATVASVRSLAKKPRCIDIAFPDRYSVAVIDGASISALDNEGLSSLAEAFYNDTYLMDQNACSSPQTIFWLNAGDSPKKAFWESVRGYAASRYLLQPQVVIDKYVTLCETIIDGKVGCESRDKPNFDGLLTVIDVADDETEFSSLRGKGGLFFQRDIGSLEDAIPLIDEKFQTLIYHGIDPHAMRRVLIENSCRGIDRIVLIGKAMDIDIVWDGYDLVSEMSRIIDVR